MTPEYTHNINGDDPMEKLNTEPMRHSFAL